MQTNKMIPTNLKLENTEVLLRPMQIDDINVFKPLVNDTQMWIYFTSNLSDYKVLSQWVETACTQMEKGLRAAFTIFSKSIGEIVGSTSFGNYSVCDNRIEIGWTWIAPKFQGKGINDASKQLMLKYGFEVLSLERIECKTDVLNLLARKALKRIGFIEEGILRSHTLMTHGRRRDTIFYGMLKSDWSKIQKH